MMNQIINGWQPRSDTEMMAIAKQAVEVLPVLGNEEELKTKAQLFKALGDETRLKIIGILKIQEACLCELVEGLEVPSSTLTHHLQILERGGVVKSRKEKKFTIFTLVQDPRFDMYLASIVK